MNRFILVEKLSKWTSEEINEDKCIQQSYFLKQKGNEMEQEMWSTISYMNLPPPKNLLANIYTYIYIIIIVI